MEASQEVVLQVQDDFILTQIKTSPTAALAELIWNSLDADATRVQVTFEHVPDAELDAGRTTSIIVADNGEGIRHEDAATAFGSLGGSWKRSYKPPLKSRVLHGRAGKGRLVVFALGSKVEWRTIYRDDSAFYSYSIRGSKLEPRRFSIGEPRPVPTGHPGTEVIIERDEMTLPSAFTDKAVSRIAGELVNKFALYLMRYPNISITIDNIAINPIDAIEITADYHVGPVEVADCRSVKGKLFVVEWKIPNVPRELHLCDDDQFSLHQIKPGIQAPGMAFTAYLQSSYFRELDDSGALAIIEMNGDTDNLISQARHRLKTHFDERAQQKEDQLIDQLKREKAYPYEGDPASTVEAAEREIFDRYAASISKGLPDFQKSAPQGKRFILELVRESIERNPEHIQALLREVVGLSQDQQRDLAKLLEQTTLPRIINATKLVADRLSFLAGLEELVYDVELKKIVKERKHLHRIVAANTWIFGEEFNLTNDDESLRTVLKTHLAEEAEVLDPILMDDGREAIVDLVIARSIPQPRAEEREYLVVELKRPSKKIDIDVLGQTRKYALAVAREPRFHSGLTRWTFWAVSSDMSEDARAEANQSDRIRGVVSTYDTPAPIKVWAKTWSELVRGAKARLEVYRKELEYSADRQSGLDFIKDNFQKYLPLQMQRRSSMETSVGDS